MFLLTALIVGFAVGLVSGGRPASLLKLGVRWNGLIFFALLVQVVIFTTWLPVPLELVPWLYVLSNLIALTWLVRNLGVAGVPFIAAGALSNVAAILANGGRMPVDGALLSRARGDAALKAVQLGHSPTNSVLASHDTRLAWLTDRFLLPPPLPFATVFSFGDVVIGLGAAWVIVAAMHRPVEEPANTTERSLAA